MKDVQLQDAYCRVAREVSQGEVRTVTATGITLEPGLYETLTELAAIDYLYESQPLLQTVFDLD